MSGNSVAKTTDRIRETDLYQPVKRFLENLGYEVKGEIGAVDVLAVRPGDEPLVIELKAGFSLTLFHQAIERLAITDAVYIAVPRGTGRAFLKSLSGNLKLCRRLGLGLITVRLKDGFTEVHADPLPYRPRQSARRKESLLKEFAKRTGDPVSGGAARRSSLMTAYRQDALRCLALLVAAGPAKAAAIAQATGTANARAIMADNHYGWFEKTARGVYGASAAGAEAALAYSAEIARLTTALAESQTETA